MSALRMTLASLANRSTTAVLTILALSLSVLLLLGVEKVRQGARQSFAATISGTDLIVGARAGDVQLLLYSVLRIGNATANFTWKSYRDIAVQPDVAWMVPISLGDSHRGFRVMGTSADYFTHYRYRNGQQLAFAAGAPFGDLFETVLGADVAAELGYALNDEIVVAHGLGRTSFAQHTDKPFRVSGVLVKTGTPVDRTVLVSLEAIEAIHVDWQSGARAPGRGVTAADARGLDLTPRAVTAAMVGLKSRLAVFRVQRYVNEYPQETLSAILPGAALQELWSIVGVAEAALTAVSAMVVATALLGMLTTIWTSLNERRREMAILRSVGAQPAYVLGLLLAEATVLASAGAIVGVVLLYASLFVLRPIVDASFGLYLPIGWPASNELLALAGVIGAGVVAGIAPAWRAYRLSIADGMIVRT